MLSLWRLSVGTLLREHRKQIKKTTTQIPLADVIHTKQVPRFSSFSDGTNIEA